MNEHVSEKQEALAVVADASRTKKDAAAELEVATAELEDTIIEAQRAGASLGEIAVVLGITRGRVHQIVKAARRRQAEEAEWMEIVAAREREEEA